MLLFKSGFLRNNKFHKFYDNKSNKIDRIDNKRLYAYTKETKNKNIYKQELFHSCENGDLSKIIELIDTKKISTRDLNTINEDGDTLLHVATRKENIEIVEYLLNKNVDYKCENKNGETAYEIAKSNKSVDIMEKIFIEENKKTIDQTMDISFCIFTLLMCGTIMILD